MNWSFSPPPNISANVLNYVENNQLLAELLARRGKPSIEQVKPFIDVNEFIPSSPYELPGVLEAVDLITDHINEDKRIGIWGDFDVDGQTSTTLLVSALRSLNAHVEFYIPIRAKESHGVHVNSLKKLLDKGVELLITCDTGISAHEAIAYAKSRDVTVIITDHHDLPDEFPNADAIINSKMLPDDHPAATLAGVGVAYKLVEALFKEHGKEQDLAELLDLVALGLVADIALLTGDTRYLVQKGLIALQNTHRLGLKELMRLAELEPSHINETHIGFAIAPRLNALGRLGDANIIVEFLTTDDPVQAAVIANQLEGLNAQRRMLTDQVFQGALAQIRQKPELLDYGAIVLNNPEWPGGIVGIVASRIVERFNKPTILLTSPPEGLAKGSARSIDGCNISKAIGENKQLLTSFGGHPMAAGMALPVENIDKFRRALSKSVLKQLGTDKTELELAIDTELSLAQLNQETIGDVETMAPFGAGNPRIVYVTRDLTLKMVKQIGRTKDHVALVIEDEAGNEQRVFWWNGADEELPNGKFDLAYSARISSFQGQQELQIEFIDYQITEPSEIDPNQAIKLVDHRQDKNPETQLVEIRNNEPDLVIWAEAQHKKTIDGQGRHELTSAEALVIWTTPPSHSILMDVIGKVAPQTVYFFNLETGMDNFKEFTNRMWGLCQFALENKDGIINLEEIAAAANQTEATIITTIKWFEAKQMLSITSTSNKYLEISKIAEISKSSDNILVLEKELRRLLNESSHFHNHYGQIGVNDLIE